MRRPEHTAPPITQDGTTVVIRGEALPLLYRAVFGLTLRQHRDGIAPTPLLTEAIRVLYRATTSRSRHPLDATTLAPASCNGQPGDLIGIAEAAEVLPDGALLSARCPRRGSSAGQRLP